MDFRSHRKISGVFIVLIILVLLGFALVSGTSEVSEKLLTTDGIKTPNDENLSKDLERSETRDSKKLEIIKKVRKINQDGSYTIGYEAKDGIFKFENRDTLGNVKGTYGYIDINGELKQISYNKSNETVDKNSSVQEEENFSNQKFNRTLSQVTTRRPNLVSSTSLPTRTSVIQTIPKRYRGLLDVKNRRVGAREYFQTTTENTRAEPTTTIVYATSVGDIRPTSNPNLNFRPFEQISRPDKLENIKNPTLKILMNNRNSPEKPVIEKIEEVSDQKTIEGSHSKRQFSHSAPKEYEQYEIQRYNNFADEDASHIFGLISTSHRPLFTTNATPRIPSLLTAARHRAAIVHRRQNLNSKKDEESPKISVNEHKLLTQNPLQVQIPASQLFDESSSVNEKHIHRRLPSIKPIITEYRSEMQTKIIPSYTHEQYHRETTPIPQSKNEPVTEQDVQEQLTQDKNEALKATFQPHFYTYPQQNEDQNDYQSHQSYPLKYQPTLYQGILPNSYPFDIPERPLTAHDFERLLQVLVLRHRQLNRRSYVQHFPSQFFNPYDIRYNRGLIFSNNNKNYNLRQFYGPQHPRYPELENMYEADNPIPNIDNSFSYDLRRLIPRKRQYNPLFFGAQPNSYVGDYETTTLTTPSSSASYLPSDVREELLYRMLLLALSSEALSTATSTSRQSLPNLEQTATSTRSPSLYQKPVRSVQILGEE